jgi:RNA polymerase sigma factor (sigma-70 family)
MADLPAELFEHYHLAIYRYLLRATGRKDIAEDLTQEVFLRVLRGAETCDPGDGARAWLFRITRNRLIDHWRHASRNPVDAALPAECSREAGHDLGLALREALQLLPEADRDAFLLRVVGGLGHEEIAAISGTSAASARSRIYRARSALRATLTQGLADQRTSDE